MLGEGEDSADEAEEDGMDEEGKEAYEEKNGTGAGEKEEKV